MRILPLALLLAASCASPPAVELTEQEKTVLRPVPNPPDEVRGLVDKGDALFLQAIPAQRSGDSVAALDFYSRARKAYLEAETHYGGFVPIPSPLLDRVRECVIRIAVLQKQRHSSP